MSYDVWGLLNALAAQAPPWIVVIIILIYLRKDISDVKSDIHTLIKFNERLLLVLNARGVATDVEVELLRGYLELPASRSKYYTKEVEARLRELLQKRVADYSWEDLVEMKRMARLIEREARETRDRKYAEQLKDFLADFRIFLAALEGLLVAKGRAPTAAKGKAPGSS